MTPEQAIAGLAPIVGGGGVAGIAIAYLGYRAEVLKGRRGEPGHPGPAIADALAGARDLEPLATAVAQLTRACTRANLLAEHRMGAVRAAAFRTWLAERELSELIAALKHDPPR